MRQVFKKSDIQLMIREEYELAQISEGMWDSISGGLKGVASWLGKQFAAASAKWTQTISGIMDKLPNVRRESQVFIDAISDAMKQSGESMKLDEVLTEAKKFGASAATISSDLEEDLQGPVYQYIKQFASNKGAAVNPQSNPGASPVAGENPATKKESVLIAPLYNVLSETELQRREAVNEALGVTAVIGTLLALLGGVPMVLGGLAKIARLLKADKTAEHLEHAEHVAHGFEKKVIDTVIPDKLAFFAFKYLTSKGIPLSKEPVENFEAFKGSKGMATTKEVLYKILLIYFAYNGLVGAFKAGVSLLGFVEGATTTVKGIELAKGAKEVANAIKSVATS